MAFHAAQLLSFFGFLITYPAGFPIRYELSDVPGFAAQAGQGVPGADIACPQSLVPGKCALGSIPDAVVTCAGMPECQAIVHYFDGGCFFLSLLYHFCIAMHKYMQETFY